MDPVNRAPTFTCPVCGYDRLLEKPRTNNGGSYEICPSCAFQFGVSDDDRAFTYDTWRDEWCRTGAHWSSSKPPPPGWNPLEQLKRIGEGPKGG